MRMHYSPRAGTGRSFGLLALLALVVLAGLAGSALGANPPAGEPAVNKHYTRDAVFHLPIKIEEKSRGSIKEVQLYVKVGQGEWQFREKAPPTQPAFKFKAPQDGEYWFTLVTVDNKGFATPNDLAHLAAEDIVMVVVDTEPPTFELKPLKAANSDLLLQCVIHDANPDYRSLRITYRGDDQLMRVLEALAGQPGIFRVPSSEVLRKPLHVSVTDLALNTAARDIVVNASVAMGSPETPQPVQPPSRPANPITVASGQVVQPGAGVVQAGASGTAGAPVGDAASHNVATPPTQNLEDALPIAPPPVPKGPPQSPPEPRQLSPQAPEQHGAPRQLINTLRASLDYRIDQVGPSGVGKVEVWLTSDNGNSWQMRCEDADRRSPADFDLPGDGLYGVRLAITNGNGFGGRAPLPGEQPQCWIEVDTTPPMVQLREVEPVTNGGTIEIRWMVNDKNLGPEPINLYYATRKEGSWQPMARGLKNDGSYRWTFPRDMGSQFFVRIEAIDQAGNVTRVDSPAAITLDMTEPRASVVGVTGVHSNPSVPRGN
jgi:hypothetical protein